MDGSSTTSGLRARGTSPGGGFAARSVGRWSPCVGPGLLQLDVDADDGEALQRRLLCFVVVVDAAASTQLPVRQLLRLTVVVGVFQWSGHRVASSSLLDLGDADGSACTTAALRACSGSS